MKPVISLPRPLQFSGNTPTQSPRVSEEAPSRGSYGSDEAIITRPRQAEPSKPKKEAGAKTRKAREIASKAGEFAKRTVKGIINGMAISSSAMTGAVAGAPVIPR